MEIKEAIQIIDNMYQERMISDKEEPNHINLAYEPKFTELEKASIVLLRRYLRYENEINQIKKILED